MKKIIVIPLDERPCNYNFNKDMTKGMPYEVVLPPMEIMGNKKTPGNMDEIVKWLKKESKNASGIVVALDTMLYGGIVPSRLHYDSKETLINRLNVLREIKADNPEILIYAYQLLMRNPAYSSSDEEPDYYADFGREIHLYGVYKHKLDLGIITEVEKEHLLEIEKVLPNEYLNDYIDRRLINSEMNNEFLNLVVDNVVEFGVIPQDDSSPYGLTALDQVKIRKTIEDKDLELKVYMYPGADEVTNTLLSKMILSFENKRPLVYLKYSSPGEGKIIPLYEDRYVSETIKYQVLAAGGILVNDLNSADLVLMVNTPSENMREAASIKRRTIEYDSFRNLVDFVEFIDYSIKNLNKPVIVADIAYANGGDLHLFKLLKQKGLLYKVAAYAGWNTSSNTLGTAIPQGVFAWLYPNREENIDFLASRYIEDIGYCSIVRSKVQNSLVEPNSYFLIDGVRGNVVNQIKTELEEFIKQNLIEGNISPKIVDIYSPWNRMFETGLVVKSK